MPTIEVCKPKTTQEIVSKKPKTNLCLQSTDGYGFKEAENKPSDPLTMRK
jgi:hypothetical protein